MKTLTTKILVLASLMLPHFAMAMNANDAAKLDAKLAALRSQTRGASISPVSREYIEKAIGKVGGNAKVEFGKSGGVIIGSGADGLVATSNISNNGGPIVVTPPITPQTSITVVGRVGSDQENKICALKIGTDMQGNVLPGMTLGPASANCSKLGTPLRLAAGKYLIYFSGSRLIVDLLAGENKVIPLREIAIANYSGITSYEVLRETCSPVELNKYRIIALATYSSELPTSFETFSRNYTEVGESICVMAIEVSFPKNSLASWGDHGNFFSVLPGVYAISWYIDGQIDYTRNIVVE